MEDAPLLALLLSSIRFASSHKGFSPIERGFRGRKPWESKGKGSKVRRERALVWRR
jgi:hypothetical protein